MSNVYKSARELGLTTGMSLAASTVTAHLLPASYTPNYDSHTTTADLPTSLATATLGTKTTTGGKFSSAPIVFTAVTNATPAAKVVLSVGGNLVACIDDFGAGPGNTSLPLNGSNITVTPNSSTGWFTIGS